MSTGNTQIPAKEKRGDVLASCNPNAVKRNNKLSVNLIHLFGGVRFTAKVEIDCSGTTSMEDVIQRVTVTLRSVYPCVGDVVFKMEKWVSL